MSVANQTVAGPPAELRFHRRIGIRTSMRELWGARELIRTLAERDIRARYKQATLGIAWSVITPIILMVVFSVFFHGVVKVKIPQGVPYPLFTYVGLLPWTFFSGCVAQGGMSLVTNNNLMNKVYCPREVFPLAACAVAAFDTTISTVILGVLFVIFTFAPKITTLWVPVIMIVQLMFTLGVTLIISSTLVYLRDLRQALPLVLQMGLFATPVVYPSTILPANLQWLYALLNPLAPIITSYRNVVLLGLPPQWGLLGLGAITSSVVFFGGYIMFKRLETGFADVA